MTLADNTARKTNSAPQLAPYRFKPGDVGNPAGRPKGSRNKITELFLQKLHADFEQHGTAVIEEVRKKRPEAYLAAVAQLVPRQTEKIESPFINLSDEELDMLEQFLKSSRAKNVTPVIEGNGS